MPSAGRGPHPRSFRLPGKWGRSFLSADGWWAGAVTQRRGGPGASIGMEPTAEVVEREARLDIVRRAGCPERQGYLASPPRPASEALSLIARFRREVAAA